LPWEAGREKELLEIPSKTLGISPVALMRRIAVIGKSFGPPWTQAEKFAALAAWLILASSAPLFPQVALPIPAG
jgi:xanthine dehydrogenase molybdopterin-binding subunit B